MGTGQGASLVSQVNIAPLLWKMGLSITISTLGSIACMILDSTGRKDWSQKVGVLVSFAAVGLVCYGMIDIVEITGQTIEHLGKVFGLTIHNFKLVP